MICEKLDKLKREFTIAADEARRHRALEETAAERRAMEAILEHKRSGHDGRPCPAA